MYNPVCFFFALLLLFQNSCLVFFAFGSLEVRLRHLTRLVCLPVYGKDTIYLPIATPKKIEATMLREEAQNTT
jgi:hypothetical protein